MKCLTLRREQFVDPAFTKILTVLGSQQGIRAQSSLKIKGRKNYPLFYNLGRQWAANTKCLGMALLHGLLWTLLSPPRLFVCLVPDAAQQAHAPRFISLLFVKRSRRSVDTAWLFLERQKKYVSWGKKNPLAWECCCAGSWPDFQLCCWRLGKLHLWHPANWVSSLTWPNSLMTLFASPAFKFLWSGGANIFYPGCWGGLEVYFFQ